jgi:alpha-ketoglutarate-dependent taurine dioxygenase
MIHLGDGTAFTKLEATDLKRKQFPACSAFKLQRGDWLVLDNLKVQHGRLPYVDDPDPQRKRTVLTVYTE